MEQYKLKKSPPAAVEGTLFLSLITFIGGYMNAYTYITRGGIFANMHTSNMSRLGICIASQDWEGVLRYLVPILACILGAAFSEVVRERLARSGSAVGDWRKSALLLELAALLLLGLVPASVPNDLVNAYVSFVTGYQLCLFRVWEASAYNTTICTGNLRGVGQLLHSAASKNSWEDWLRFLRFFALVFTFTAGSLVGALLCTQIGVRAVWVCCALIGAIVLWMGVSEKQQAELQDSLKKYHFEK